MITPNEAEELARKTVEGYVNQCGCKSVQDVANVLTKLASMSGLAMCYAVGQEEAVVRLEGTTNYIARPEHAGPYEAATVQ